MKEIFGRKKRRQITDREALPQGGAREAGESREWAACALSLHLADVAPDRQLIKHHLEVVIVDDGPLKQLRLQGIGLTRS